MKKLKNSYRSGFIFKFLMKINRHVNEHVEYWHEKIILKIISLKHTINQKNKSKKNFVFWVPGGMPLMLHVEASLGYALKLRGHKVHLVICDGEYTACIKRELSQNIPIQEWKNQCSNCKKSCQKVIEKFGLDYSFIGDYVSRKEKNEISNKISRIEYNSVKELNINGIFVGKNILSSLIRFTKSQVDEIKEEYIKEYCYSGLISLQAAQNAFDILKPTNLFMSHAIYVDWGPALQVAITKNISVMAWQASYLPYHFYFGPISDINRVNVNNISRTTWAQLSNQKFTPEKAKKLNEYLLKRYKLNNCFDMKEFKQFCGDKTLLKQKLQLTENKKIWAIFCHISWDSVSDLSPMAFENFLSWLTETIKTISQVTNVFWLIKIHPAEEWEEPTGVTLEFIKKHFPSLPNHIKIINASHDINPLDFYNLIDGGVTVYGTPGLELATLGKPVILAGEAHYSSKGFTYDGFTKENYVNYLISAPTLSDLSEKQIELAQLYAFDYFISRQIMLPVVKNKNPENKWWHFNINESYRLLPEADQSIELICSSLVHNSETNNPF